jgi:hypothetical protein
MVARVRCIWHHTPPMWIVAAIGNLFIPVQRTAQSGYRVRAIVLIVKGVIDVRGSDTKRGVFVFTVTLFFDQRRLICDLPQIHDGANRS